MSKIIHFIYINNFFPEHVYCTETRPYNQGARLTAFELVHDKIPGTLICDDMVAALMKSRTINAVIVGADRVVANGDTANKIGTYQVKNIIFNNIHLVKLPNKLLAIKN